MVEQGGMIRRASPSEDLSIAEKNSATSQPTIKRRRVIKSCEQCRQKKLKCDKNRPCCGSCSKQRLECLYVAPSDDSNIIMIDSKIQELRHQLELLRDKRDKLLKTFPQDSQYLKTDHEEVTGELTVFAVENELGPSNSTTTITSTTPLSASSPQSSRMPQQASELTVNTMNRRFLVGSIVSTTSYVKKHDPFYKSLLENLENSNNNKLPLQETSREKAVKISTALLETEKINRNVQLYELIKPHLMDYPKVLRLVNHFFSTQLYSVYSFLDKPMFLLQFYQLYGGEKLSPSIKQADYIFLGQLLIILRMSLMSFYSGGSVFVHQHDVKDEVIPLAKLCIREIDRSFIAENVISYIQLLMLLNYYQIHSPEYGANSGDYLQFDITRLLKICLDVRFNVDPGDNNPRANLIRKIWFHIMELNYVKFIYDGDPLLVGNDTIYTTKLPSLDLCEDEVERAVIINIRKRAQYHLLFDKAYKLVSNVVNPVDLSVLKALTDDIHSRIINLDLFNMINDQSNSNTLLSKLSKLADLSTLLDLYILFIDISIPLFYNFKDNNSYEMSQDVLLKWTKLTSSMLMINYFIDSNQLSIKFNLHSQFGYTFHLIGRILEASIRMINIQATLLSRVCYYSTVNQNSYTASFHKIRDILFKNLKVLLFNIGKMGEVCLAAKEIHFLNVFKIIKNFGKGSKCGLSKSYLELLQQNELLKKTTKIDESFCTLVVENLTELKGETSNLDIDDHRMLKELNSSDAKIDLYFENLHKNVFDFSYIDKFDSMIEKESFLS